MNTASTKTAITNVVIPLVLGVSGSLIASFLFLWWLSSRVPNVRISDIICASSLPDGKLYEIKIINDTPRDITNVRFQLLLCRRIAQHGGDVIECDKVQLRRDDVLSIAGFDRTDKDYCYAFRVTTQEPLEQRWQDYDFLELRMSANDSQSNYGKVFVQKYQLDKDLVEGSFAIGNTLEVRGKPPARKSTGTRE